MSPRPFLVTFAGTIRERGALPSFPSPGSSPPLRFLPNLGGYAVIDPFVSALP